MTRCLVGRLAAPLAGLAFLLAAAACDSRDGSADEGGSPRRVVTTGPAGTGVIRGVVTFNGMPPEPEEVEGARCHPGAGPIRVAPVVVGDSRGLKDVMVYVDQPPVVPADTSKGPTVLDQVDCQYVPHVLGLRAGQVLRVKSSDPAMHNVHALSERNPGFNFGMTRPGESRDLTFARPEQFVVKCDVHPWMTAHVYVFEHPFFAVTGEGGAFEIAGLPPGGHEVVFSHPFLGERRRRCEVDAGAARLDVTFEKGQ
jgi:plastocyanin